MEGLDQAVLSHADRPVRPESAGPGAVADAIVATGGLDLHCAFIVRVEPISGRSTLRCSVAGEAQAAVEFRIAVQRMRRAGSRHGGTRLAIAVTRRVAAIAVHAVGGQTLAIFPTRKAVGPADLADPAITPGIIGALRIGQATRVASKGAIAQVWMALPPAVVHARSGTVAGVRVVLDVAVTVLVEADRPGKPVATGTAAVTGSVQSAAVLIGPGALVQRVGSGRNDRAGTGSVAGLTEAAIVFRVRIRFVWCATAFVPSAVTSLAFGIAGHVAAVSVHAEVGLALHTIDTILPVIELLFTDRSVAPIPSHAFVMLQAGEQAFCARQVAYVRVALHKAGFDAASRTIAVVLWIERVTEAGLGDTYGAGSPVSTGSVACAKAVELAGVRTERRAVADRVFTVNDQSARAGSTACPTRRAVIFRVGIFDMWDTLPLEVGLVAGFTGQITG